MENTYDLEKLKQILYLKWGFQMMTKDEALLTANRNIESLKVKLKEYQDNIDKFNKLPWYKRIFKKI